MMGGLKKLVSIVFMLSPYWVRGDYSNCQVCGTYTFSAMVSTGVCLTCRSARRLCRCNTRPNSTQLNMNWPLNSALSSKSKNFTVCAAN
jgi:hypothetical protein